GPFYRLLHARPREALALIHRMLDHAVARGAAWDPDPPPEPDAPEPLPPGLDLDLPGVGVRRCVGDEQVWSWYRGSPGAPPACVSALLAVERFADELVNGQVLSLGEVSEWLLRDCHNLAIPALVVGLLVRHLGQAGDLIDRWLVYPELWYLETMRAVGGRLHIYGVDPPDLVGRHRRAANFQDVVAELVVRAMLVGDHDRLVVLAAKGDELIARARGLAAGQDDEADFLFTVSGWASVFRAENHRLSQTEDGHLRHEWTAPEELAEALAPAHEEFARGDDAYRLEVTYAQSEDRVADVATLTEDLMLARDLAQNPPRRGPANPADPVAAVAAAAIIAQAQGRVQVHDSHIRWAADILIDAATGRRTDGMRHAASWNQSGADRSAAVALPALLLPAFAGVELNHAAITEALKHSATRQSDEVRAAFALGLEPLWAAPCTPNRPDQPCHHQTAWDATQASLRDCRLGAWHAETQERLPDPLQPPYEETLSTVATERLLVNRLTAPIVATAAAARSNACIAPQAARLRDVLFEAHRRGTDHWATQGYDHPHNRHRDRVVRVLIETAIAGDVTPLTTYVRDFTTNARALDQLLHDLRELFTYNDTLRPALLPVWRHVMTTALDALEAGADLHGRHHWRDGALAGLLPTPQITHSDDNPMSTLERVRPHWLDPDTIADLVTRWMPLTVREPRAVDAVVDLAYCGTPTWQASTGLTWTETLIDGDFAAVARRCWGLTDWLHTVRTSGHLDPNSESCWQRLVDGLAAHGDHRAVSLQQAQE
ncbi:MAG TPA: hypothetical protein VFU98_13935, partial [Microlunatus sp.]|nr:hypothetical protein [Microlunatus sp.]